MHKEYAFKRCFNLICWTDRLAFELTDVEGLADDILKEISVQ